MSASYPLPYLLEPLIWHHSFDGYLLLGKVKQPPKTLGRRIVRFLDNPAPALFDLPESALRHGAPRPLWLPVPPHA